MRHVIVLTLLLVLAPTLAAAQAYRWVDDNGVVHFSGSLNDIPEKYRSSVVPLGVTPPVPPAIAPPGPWEIEDPQGRRLRFSDRAKCEEEAEKISQVLNKTVFCTKAE